MLPRCPSSCLVLSLLATAVLGTAGGCVVTRAAVTPLKAEPGQGRRIRAQTKPAKVHLRDGSAVLFPRGFTVDGDVLSGAGVQYDLARTHGEPVESVPVGQVTTIVGYGREIAPAESAVGTLAAAPLVYATVLGVVALAILLSLH